MITETTTLKGTLGERIRRLMDLKGLSKADLSRETGVPVMTIEYLVDGSTYNPRIATLLAIVNYLHVSLDQLVGPSYLANSDRDLQMQRSIDKRVPLLEWNDVVYWCKRGHDFLKDDITKWVTPQQAVSAKSFALTVTHQSEGVFPEDSIIIIDPQIECISCGYVLATIQGGRPCIRRISYENDSIYLHSLSDKSLVEVSEDNRIIGKIVEQYMHFTQQI